MISGLRVEQKIMGNVSETKRSQDEACRLSDHFADRVWSRLDIHWLLAAQRYLDTCLFLTTYILIIKL